MFGKSSIPILDDAQRVEYLIDSINCSDSVLQAALGLVQANINSVKTDFELAGSLFIEVDHYRRSQRPNTSKPGGENILLLTLMLDRDLMVLTLGGIIPRSSRLFPTITNTSCVRGRKLPRGNRS